MKTVTITRTVVRTADSALDVSVEMPEGSTDEQIREAILDKATNMVFSTEHHSDYRLLDELGQEDEAKAQSDIHWILDELVKLGFHKDQDISGADVVEVVKTIFDDLTSGVHRPATYEPYFIYSQPEDAFWCQNDGWVDLCDATPFYKRPTSLPVTPPNGVRIVTAEQADVISKYWQQGDDEPQGAPA